MISTIQKIKKDFNEVISYSQGIPNPHTEKLFDLWYEAKRHIIDTWGGKLIIESEQETSFYLSAEERRKRLSEFINSVDEIYGNDELATFLEDVEKDFFSNHLSTDYCCINGVKISKGTKVVKAFKYFESNEKALQDLQTQASMIIQEDKVSGYLCLSVHPLDYLSASENTYHWRSCHALDGDYRAGNLSYMLDRSTIICYLKTGDKLHKLPNFPDTVPWNSKKWRMFLFLEDEVEALMAGRQYPFFSPTALNQVMSLFCKNWYPEMDFHYRWSGWMSDYIIDFPRSLDNNNNGYVRNYDSMLKEGRHIALDGVIYSMKSLITDAPGSRHFNDLLYSTCYIPMYCYQYIAGLQERKLHFSIGAAVPCLHCGECDIDTDNAMHCLECGIDLTEKDDERYIYCGCCQRRTPRNLSYWNNSIDELLCEDCHNLHASACDNCGDSWYSDDMLYSYDKNQYLCPCCTNSRRF